MFEYYLFGEFDKDDLDSKSYISCMDVMIGILRILVF